MDRKKALQDKARGLLDALDKVPELIARYRDSGQEGKDAVITEMKQNAELAREYVESKKLRIAVKKESGERDATPAAETPGVTEATLLRRKRRGNAIRHLEELKALPPGLLHEGLTFHNTANRKEIVCEFPAGQIKLTTGAALVIRSLLGTDVDHSVGKPELLQRIKKNSGRENISWNTLERNVADAYRETDGTPLELWNKNTPGHDAQYFFRIAPPPDSPAQNKK